MGRVLAVPLVVVATACGLSAVGTAENGAVTSVSGGDAGPGGIDDRDGASSANDASDGAASDASFVCPPNYFPHAGSRYRYDPTLTTWLNAEARCEAEGTHLAVISSTAERDAVLGIATTEIWVGSSDRVVENVWRDVTGAATLYFVWDSSEPSTSSEDDCMLLRKLDENGTPNTMDAKPCSAPTPHAFVCECDGLPALPGTAY